MKLLSKIGEYVAMAIGFPVLVACFLASLCVSGILFLALVAWLTKPIFGAWLDHMPDPPIGYIIYAATGGLVWLCGTVVWHAWERRRAVEEEIKIVSDIQIIEPSPRGPVQRFFDKDGTLDRFYERHFWWIEDIEDKWNRFTEVWGELPFVAQCFGVIAIGFMVGAPALWLAGVSFQAHWIMIPIAIVAGWIAIFGAAFVVWVVLMAITLPLAIPYFAWCAAKRIIEWVAHNLPRGLVIRYNQWKLRHGFVKRHSMDWLTAIVAIMLIILSVVGLKACNHDAPDGEDDAEEGATY